MVFGTVRFEWGQHKVGEGDMRELHVGVQGKAVEAELWGSEE